jgi:hypothetical protein
MSAKNLVALACLALSLVSGLRAETVAPGKEGAELIAFLRANYAPRINLSYRQARRVMFSRLDNQDGWVRLVYTGRPFRTRDIPNPNQVNTEHTWPQSMFKEAAGKQGMKSDLHHLFPTYNRVNGERGHKAFDEISDDSTHTWWNDPEAQYDVPGDEIDEYSEATDELFEPREDHKGNVARAPRPSGTGTTRTRWTLGSGPAPPGSPRSRATSTPSSSTRPPSTAASSSAVEGEAGRLAKQLGLSRARCAEALGEAGGDPERALRALLKSGEVDPTQLDPTGLPNWVFTEAQLARTRAMMGEMAIPTELQTFFEATLGQVGAEDRRLSELRAPTEQGEGEDEGPVGLAGRRLKDLEFGQLEWDDGWWGRTRVPGFYGQVPMQVESPRGDPPGEGQRRAARSLESLDEGFRAELQAVLLGFYEGLRTARPDKLEPLDEPADIWQAMDGPVVFLARQADEDQRVDLRFRRAGGGARHVVVRLRAGQLDGIGLR